MPLFRVRAVSKTYYEAVIEADDVLSAEQVALYNEDAFEELQDTDIFEVLDIDELED